MFGFLEKRKQHLKEQEENITNNIANDSKNSELECYAYIAGYWIIFLLNLIIIKFGDPPALVALAAYFLIVNLFYRKLNLNPWLSTSISVITALILEAVSILLILPSIS